MDRTDLEARLRDIDDLLARLDADDASLRADRADATADDEHDPEGSTLSGEWQRVEALRRARLAERHELEEALLLADVGVGPTTEILDHVRATVKEQGITEPDALVAALKDKGLL